ncbi:ChbG/HpnK family deacetylase [Ramlibacter sp. PS4R-6]|uniref:ChbG/HpnK family deacetylase n=1 Tax=Ramlibacter sp. PS4R-6 TaxID=3133438 RepID=UPI0030A9AAFA
MTARIAICIDDYGLHPAVDEAILALVGRGRVSATSCLVGGPAWTQDAPRLKQAFDAGRVDAGLHLDLTEDPLDATLRKPVGAWMRDSLLRTLDRKRVRAELVAQLDRFEATMGRAPAHVDGHQHIHQFPVVRDIVIEELERRYAGGHRPWLRSIRGAARWRFKGMVIETMGALAWVTSGRRTRLPQNRSLLGVYDFRGGADRYRRLLADWMAHARDGDLLMAHVATGIVPGDEIAQPRVVEWEVFSQDGFDEVLRGAGVTVVRMSEIVAAS